MRAYITNLGKYNEGYLIGEWVKFPIEEEEFEAVLEHIGIDENYEEWFVTDYEDTYVQLEEYISYEELQETAEAIEDIDEQLRDAIPELLDYYESIADAALAIDKGDAIVWWGCDCMADVAEQYVTECYDLPELALRYFDYEAFARDLEMDATFIECEQAVIECR